MSNDFLFGDKTLTFIFMYKYNNIRLIYVNYKSLNNTLKSALVNKKKMSGISPDRIAHEFRFMTVQFYHILPS